MFWLKRNLPRLVIAPSFGVLAWFVYGFILWTIYISFTKSKLLLEMKRFFESEELIRDQLIRRNEDPELWLLLSEIQRNSKNIVGYHQSRAEYFLLLGQNEQALGQLEFALNLTKNNFQVSERIMNQIISIKKAIGESRGF